MDAVGLSCCMRQRHTRQHFYTWIGVYLSSLIQCHSAIKYNQIQLNSAICDVILVTLKIEQQCEWQKQSDSSFHRRQFDFSYKSTGVTHNINDGCALFKWRQNYASPKVHVNVYGEKGVMGNCSLQRPAEEPMCVPPKSWERKMQHLEERLADGFTLSTTECSDLLTTR